MTAIVASKLMTTCHQPPGINTVSPGQWRISSFNENRNGNMLLRVTKSFMARENYGREKESPSLALGICECHKSYFYTDQTLELIESWFLERFANFYSVLSRENSINSRHYNILNLFASRQSCADLMTFETIKTIDLSLQTSQKLDFRLTTISKNNFSEIHISRPTP